MKMLCDGEAMIELDLDRPGKQIAYAGDAFNTAVCPAREIGASPAVDFVTALGRDPNSDRMESLFRTERVGTARSRRHPERRPGICAIALDEHGACSFTGGFLAATLAGQDTAPTMERAHALAARVIGFPGAIIPKGAADAP